MKWISVKNKLPEIDMKKPEYSRNTKVIACWGTKTENMAEMEYCSDIIRGKEVRRFKWQGRISHWTITHWMPFPSPPEDA